MATEVQTILVKYQADISDLKREVDDLKRANNQAGDSGQKAGKEIEQGYGRAEKSVGGLSKAVKSLGGVLAAAFTAQQAARFTVEIIRSGDAQIKAEAQLLTALKGRKDVQESLIKQASELQKRTLFGDEVTVAAQSRIAAFVQEEEAIKELTRVSQDFAAAKGIDLNSAADLITKSFASSNNALSRYGIEIEGAAGSSERLTSITTALDGAFKGQAETLAKTGLGPLVQLQNAIGDIGEEIGKQILESIPQFTDKLEGVVDVAGRFTTQLFNAEERVGTIGKAAQLVATFFDGLKIRLEFIGDLFGAFITTAVNVGKSLGFIREDAGTASSALDVLNKVAAFGNTVFEKTGDVLFNVFGVWNGLVSSFRTGSQEVVGFFQEIGQATDLLFKGKFKQAAEATKDIDFDFKAIGQSFTDGFDAILDIRQNESLKKSAEESGKAIGAAITDNAADEIKGGNDKLSEAIEQAAADAIRELEILLQNREFELKFRVSADTAEFFDPNNVAPIAPIAAGGTDTAIDLAPRGVDDLADAADAYDAFTQQIAGANEELALSGVAVGNDLFGALATAIGASAELASAQLAFEKLVAVAEIVINLQKEIALIGANPTLSLLPDGGLSEKGILIAQAKLRAGIGVAAVLATAIPEFALASGSADTEEGLTLVGERGPEIMMMPKGAAVFTAEASRNQRDIIDALNEGRIEDYIRRTYVTPAILKERLHDDSGGRTETMQPRYPSTIELGNRTIRKLTADKAVTRYR